MPAPKQPERGNKSPYSARYLVDIPGCTGVDLSHDPSTIEDTALRQGINARIHDGIVLSRGGQTAVPNSPENGCVQGLIDIDGVGTRAVLADNDLAVGGSGNPAAITFFDEGGDDPYTSIDSKVVPHPLEGNTQAYDSWEDDKPRYVYHWWDGNIVFQDAEEGELHKIILPEEALDNMDEVQVEALFPCSIPGDGGFTASSMTTMPQVSNVTTQPLYFGTMGGGVVGYINGQMRRLLPDATFSGRVIVFQYNNRLYAAGDDDLWVQNGWSAGNDASSTSWTQVALPGGPTDFRPMCGIEWGGYGWIGGYDLDAVGPAVNSGYIFKINDGSGTPIVTVGVNDCGGVGDWLQSVDDLGTGLGNQFIVAYRFRTTGGSAFGAFDLWDGAAAALPSVDLSQAWGESGGMCQRVQGNHSKVYAVGYGSDTSTSIEIWDGSSVSSVVIKSADTESPFDMVLF